MTRADLPEIVLEALSSMKGQGTIVQICEYIWNNYEQDLRKSGDLFYSWQYDMRWAGQQLRDTGQLKKASNTPRGVWVVAK